MRKLDELSQPESCLSRARHDEMVFVLLGRDKAFEATVQFWINERIRLGLNMPTDKQIVSAYQCMDDVANGR